ncbi:MAG: histidinol phosphate phosphatase [Alphaproteobacteria bacterium]|nr:histidinol phosphate phosphatase [Alphaproteobacteria bacterium]
MDDFIKLAHAMADEAGSIILQHFREPFEVDVKSDESPVTVTDRAVETRLRQIVMEHRPEDGVCGEEFGNRATRSGYTWVFDPVDGTKQFASGRPTFVTLIALCHEGYPVMSIMDQPVLKERWVGVKGRPTTFNGKPCHTRKCPELRHARTGITSPRNFSNYETLPAIHSATQYIAWGGHGYGFGQLASGWLDLVLEKHFGPFDTLPVVPIVEGAGGVISDWRGGPPNLESKDKVVACGDPALHEQILDVLRACSEPAALPLARRAVA